MAKKERYPDGFYRPSIGAGGESEDSGSSGRTDADVTASEEDSAAPIRKCINLNSDRFGVPIQVHAVSRMSTPEKKDLIARLKLELNQIQTCRRKFESGSVNVMAYSSSSDIFSFNNSQSVLPVSSRGNKGIPQGSKACRQPRDQGVALENAQQAPALSNSLKSAFKQCEALLEQVMVHKYAYVFNEPVDVVKLNIPDYLTIIKNPMDLGTVKAKLAAASYSSPHDFLADVRLTFSNAMTYNPRKDDVHIMAKTLRKFFEARWRFLEKKLPGPEAVLLPEKLGAPQHPRMVTARKRPHMDTVPQHPHMGTAPQRPRLETAPHRLHMENAPKNPPMDNALKNLRMETAPKNLHMATAPKNLHMATAPKNLRMETAPKNLHMETAPQKLRMEQAPKNPRLEKPRLETAPKNPRMEKPRLETAPKNPRMEKPRLETAPKNPRLETAPKKLRLEMAQQPVQMETCQQHMQMETAQQHMQIETAQAPSKKRKLSPAPSCVLPQPVKRMMTDEKHRLSRELESLLGELPDRIISFLKEQCSGQGEVEDDEIEIDLDDLTDETLFELRKLIDDYLQEKQKNQDAKMAEPCEIELLHGSGLSNSSLLVEAERGNDLDDDIDIGGSDSPVSSYPPVEIDKDFVPRSESDNSENESENAETPLETSRLLEAGGSTEEIENKTVPLDDNPSASGQEADQIQTCSFSEGQQDGDNVPNGRQLSPDKRYRAALLKSRFADTILKAREKTLSKDDKMDPEKLRREREELEMQKRKEKARLQAEAKAAEDAQKRAEAEAKAEAKRKREHEREAARQALLQMEKTVNIHENIRTLEDLEMLRTGPPEHLPSSADETSPEHNEDGLNGFRFGGGSNPLEQLGLFMKEDEEEEEAAELPSIPSPGNDVEEGEID